MASINTIVKRKQYLWLGIVVVGTASAIGGALYLSDVDMSGNGETVAEQEPVPDMTGVAVVPWPVVTRTSCRPSRPVSLSVSSRRAVLPMWSS